MLWLAVSINSTINWMFRNHVHSSAIQISYVSGIEPDPHPVSAHRLGFTNAKHWTFDLVRTFFSLYSSLRSTRTHKASFRSFSSLPLLLRSFYFSGEFRIILNVIHSSVDFFSSFFYFWGCYSTPSEGILLLFLRISHYFIPFLFIYGMFFSPSF